MQAHSPKSRSPSRNRLPNRSRLQSRLAHTNNMVVHEVHEQWPIFRLIILSTQVVKGKLSDSQNSTHSRSSDIIFNLIVGVGVRSEPPPTSLSICMIKAMLPSPPNNSSERDIFHYLLYILGQPQPSTNTNHAKLPRHQIQVLPISTPSYHSAVVRETSQTTGAVCGKRERIYDNHIAKLVPTSWVGYRRPTPDYLDDFVRLKVTLNPNMSGPATEQFNELSVQVQSHTEMLKNTVGNQLLLGTPPPPTVDWNAEGGDKNETGGNKISSSKKNKGPDSKICRSSVTPLFRIRLEYGDVTVIYVR